jgi:sulfane dehydrogenase subunit SoxC
MAVRDALEGYDEKTKTQVEAMIDAERRALARRDQEAEDCSCKTGMFPQLGRRSVLVAAGSALAASLAPLPTPTRAAERKAPAGAVWREAPNDPTKVPGTATAEDGGYGSRS